MVEASLQILSDSNAHFLRLLGDESLRSLSRGGRAIAAGSRDDALPDGRLFYRPAGEGNTPSRVDLEILVSKYTDAQIRKKYDELGPSGTLFFAPTARLCQRVVALGYPRPRLIS